MLESMESMQRRVIERANRLRKPGESYPRAVVLFPGIVAIAHSEAKHRRMMRGQWWSLGIGVALGVLIPGIIAWLMV